MSHVAGFNGVNGCQIVKVCDCDESVIGSAMIAHPYRSDSTGSSFAARQAG
jgi:hypothetical protein